MHYRTDNLPKRVQRNKIYFRYNKYPTIYPSTTDILIRTTGGDRLDNLAMHFYNDPHLWWIIVQANPDVLRRDSLRIKPGLELRIPQKSKNIKEVFSIINK